MYKDRAGAITIFRCVGEKSRSGTTPAKLQQLENAILGREGVMYVPCSISLQFEYFNLGTLLIYGTMQVDFQALQSPLRRLYYWHLGGTELYPQRKSRQNCRQVLQGNFRIRDGWARFS